MKTPQEWGAELAQCTKYSQFTEIVGRITAEFATVTTRLKRLWCRWFGHKHMGRFRYYLPCGEHYIWGVRKSRLCLRCGVES